MRKIAIIVFLLTLTVLAQNTDNWQFTGGVQLRTELDGRDFSNKTYPLFFSSLRTRFAVAKSLGDKVSFYAQFQDSRMLGETGNTLASLKNTDLHQAYVTVNNPLDLPFSTTAGRFELAYGTERFIGSVGWHYIGRSFDGMKLSLSNVKADVFFLTHTETQGYIAAATPAYSYPAQKNKTFSIYGFWTKPFTNDKHTVEVLGYYENNRVQTNGVDNDLAKLTLALSHWGNYDKLKTITEVAFQSGKEGAKKVSAYLISVSGNYSLGSVSLGLGADLLSGNKVTDTVKNNCFSPTYGTNHKYYGYMDYFINIPVNTKNLGLNDIYLMYNLNKEGSPWTFGLNAHYFTTAQKDAQDKSALGQEFDLTVKYNIIKGAVLQWGGSVFLPGDVMKTFFKSVNGAREDMSFWSYIMITANF